MNNCRRFALIVLGLWMVVILGVTLRGIVAPHQNSVFLVFRDAGRDWLGAQPLYLQVGKYLYSPLAAAFFAPFALLQDWAGSALWHLGTGLVYLLAVVWWFLGRDELPTTQSLGRGQLSERAGPRTEGVAKRSDGGPRIRTLFRGKDVVTTESTNERELLPADKLLPSGKLIPAERLLPTVLGLLLLLPLSIGNLNNGQASPFIIALLLIGCLAVLDGRWTLAAGCISFAAFFKIYPLAIGLLLAVIEPRKLVWRLVFGLLIFGALSLVLQRPPYVLEQYRDWWLSLGADQRRVSTELGSWRDAWLLLRILHLPITVAGYAVLQAGTALAAATFCWWRSRTWDRPAVVWTAFTVGCLWITLFGPSTELATYVFIAPSVAFACSWVLWPMIQGRLGWHWFQFFPIAAYALLLLAEALNAWVPVIRENTYLHAIQPVAALLFLGFVVGWKPASQPVDVAASWDQ